MGGYSTANPPLRTTNPHNDIDTLSHGIRW
jgi:hypothetical protein